MCRIVQPHGGSQSEAVKASVDLPVCRPIGEKGGLLAEYPYLETIGDDDSVLGLDKQRGQNVVLRIGQTGTAELSEIFMQECIKPRRVSPAGRLVQLKFECLKEKQEG